MDRQKRTKYVREGPCVTEVYSGDSSICEAAVHTGVITREQGGTVSIEVQGKQQSFRASQRNGVLSKGYGSYSSSFIVIP